MRQPLRETALGSIVFAGAMLAVAVTAEAQPAVHRIGYLGSTKSRAFSQGLRDLGYVEGKNLVIIYPSAEKTSAASAAELVHLKVDVIVTGGATVTRAAKEATSTIPIVFLQDPDPVGNGLVTSLARPAGNITGLSSMTVDLTGKRLELLREVLPKLSRLAVLGQSANAANGIQLREAGRNLLPSLTNCLSLQLSYIVLSPTFINSRRFSETVAQKRHSLSRPPKAGCKPFASIPPWGR